MGRARYRTTARSPRLNAALAGLTFAPPTGFHGDTTLSLYAGSFGVEPLQAQVTITDGVFRVTTTADTGPGSLRQAILDSNAATGATNVIDFAIAGSGVQTISPLSPLPAVTNPVLIDGLSEPGYAGTPLVEIDGSQAGGGDGLLITGADSTVRDLDIDNFSQGAGIHIAGSGATGDWVYGCFLGTDPTGTQVEPNNAGVEIDGGADGNTIGGANAGAGNIISGNDQDGVVITGQGTTGNQIAGNDIGTDGTGTVAVPNDGAGIIVESGASDNTIGGYVAAAGNLVTSNYGPGVAVGSDAMDTSVGDEIIGNRIYGNISSSFSGSVFYGASGQAIDLGDDGVTTNAAGPRQGPNNLQNFPVIIGAGAGQLLGWLQGSLPATTFRIEFFASAAYNPDGAGEAQDFLGAMTVTTDASGQAVFTVPYAAPVDLPIITATATDPQGNTSELTAERTAVLQSPPAGPRAVANQPLIFSTGLGDGITIQDPLASVLDPVWDLSLSVSAGTLTLASTAGLVGTGDGTGSLSYSGPVSIVDAALDGLTYTPPAGFHFFATLTASAGTYGATSLEAQLTLTDGVFVVSTTADSGPGSLRQAILDSNAATGATNVIDFAIAGSGMQTISPLSPLPAITNPLDIDGTTQPGYAGTPLIAIIGQGAGDTDPLTGDADVTVKGLAIDGYSFSRGSSSSMFTIELVPLPQAPGGTVMYQIAVSAGEALLATAQASGATTSLSLVDAQGHIVMQSDGLSTADPIEAIDTYIASGTYSLQVRGGGGGGDFTLTAMVSPASAPFQPISVGLNPVAMVAGDFSGDGHLDLAVANEFGGTVSVLLGNGDGTFQPQVTYAVGSGPVAIVAGDFTGDGHLDLAVANEFSGTVSVLLGNGDGTFQPQVTYAVGSGPDCHRGG